MKFFLIHGGWQAAWIRAADAAERTGSDRS